MAHLQTRPADWESATDDEITSALLDRQQFVSPFWMAWIQQNRPRCLRRALRLHEDLGGYLGAPARRWLARGRR